MTGRVIWISCTIFLMTLLMSCTAAGPLQSSPGASPPGVEPVPSSTQPPVGNGIGNNQSQEREEVARGGPYTNLLGLNAQQVEEIVGMPPTVTLNSPSTVCWRFDALKMGVCLADGTVVSVNQEEGWVLPTLKIGDDEEQVNREIGVPLLRPTPQGKELIAIRETERYVVEVVVADGRAVRARTRVAGGED